MIHAVIYRRTKRGKYHVRLYRAGGENVTLEFEGQYRRVYTTNTLLMSPEQLTSLSLDLGETTIILD